ncbi:glycine-rich domain-containing protein [Amycolatopsis sp. lyj-346]|uniref:glycine-rich domain-containing protein n=1 Tax=Amycolatopsis sp. lyj-346 TaxID=2789289 RepID=UPI0039794989
MTTTFDEIGSGDNLASAEKERDGQDLVPEELFDRLVDRIAREHQLGREYAVRIMGQALAFLGTCARSAEPLAPSDIVDIGWHTFLLYTREYAGFCDRVAGRFIHHEPADTGLVPISRTPRETASRTITAVRLAGFAVDLPLWTTPADCHQCNQGCTHSSGDTGCHHLVGAATVRS